MPEQLNPFVVGYTFKFGNGPQFVPVSEGNYIEMVRAKIKGELIERHGNRIIKGCPWDIRPASDAFPKVKIS